jgi:hypothetical protein
MIESWFSKIDIRLIQRIAQLLQSDMTSLAELSQVSQGVRAPLLPMLRTLRGNVWHSCNIDLLTSTVWTGEPEQWMSRRNAATLERYEALRERPHVKQCECSAFNSGQHREPFNKLHGFYTLTDCPLPGRYQAGLHYPYIGMSCEVAANCRSELCMHPPEHEHLAIVLAFICPLQGMYMISDIGLRLIERRGQGPVVMDVVIVRTGDDLEEKHECVMSLTAVGTLGHDRAGTQINVQMNKGDRIAFSVSMRPDGRQSLGGFSFGAVRVSWHIRHGVFFEA